MGLRNWDSTDNVIHQDPVFQRMNSADHQKIAIQWKSIGEINYSIHWMVIYRVDSVIQPLNYWGQKA